MKKTTNLPNEFSIPHYEVNQTVKDMRSLGEVAETQRERINWAQSMCRIPDIWSETQGEGVRVAILDTGVDVDHPDLQTAILETKDFTGDGIEDLNGHGTHCAGVIGARANGVGFVGVAPKCELLIGKVLNNQGSGSYEWIAQGIEWAVEQKAHLISMSLGGPSSSAQLYSSVLRGLSETQGIICAAGNSGSWSENNIGFPGRYGGVITVASHDQNGNRSGFSSRGGEIDVMAPGEEIWSTYKDGGYAELSGTSMATPFVVGLSALVIAKHINTPTSETPIQNTVDLREHLLRMAAHPGFHDNERGYGPLQPFSFFKTSYRELAKMKGAQ